jgi:hypothetical protein
MNYCSICGRLLGNPDDLPASEDCGGDCTKCMADEGDPDAILAMTSDCSLAVYDHYLGEEAD